MTRAPWDDADAIDAAIAAECDRLDALDLPEKARALFHAPEHGCARWPARAVAQMSDAEWDRYCDERERFQ